MEALTQNFGTLIAAALTVIVPVGGAILTMHWKISNMSTRLDALEHNGKKRDDDHACLDKKVDEIRIELAKIETKLDILVAERTENNGK